MEEQIERLLLTQEQIRFRIERFRKLNIENEEDKKRLIDNFINAIYLYDDKITFTFNYKDGTKRCSYQSVIFGSDTYCFGPPEKDKPCACLFSWWNRARTLRIIQGSCEGYSCPDALRLVKKYRKVFKGLDKQSIFYVIMKKQLTKIVFLCIIILP